MKMKYFIMYKLIKFNIISEKRWTDFTMKILDELLEKNKNVLIRLKNI